MSEAADPALEDDRELVESVMGTPEETLPVPIDDKTELARLDPLRRYLLEISRFKPLSPEEEKELVRRYRDDGDQRAAYELVTSNLQLVVKIARLYSRVYQNVIDLIQEGNIGLIEAVKRFDPERGARLPTYASWWIKAYIIKFILDNFRIVRVGTTNQRRKLLFNLRKEKERLRLQGIEPTPQLIAKRLNVSVEDVRAVESNIESADVSLEAPVGGEDGRMRFVDTLQGAEERVDESLARGELQELFNRELERFSKRLDDREQTILRERLTAEEPLTLQQIAERYGVTREAIRLTEKKLIARIKEHMETALGDVTDLEFGLIG